MQLLVVSAVTRAVSTVMTMSMIRRIVRFVVSFIVVTFKLDIYFVFPGAKIRPVQGANSRSVCHRSEPVPFRFFLPDSSR